MIWGIGDYAKTSVFDHVGLVGYSGDGFVIGKGNGSGGGRKVAFSLQFIPPDITLVEDGVFHLALAQEVAAGKGGVLKVEVEWVIFGDTVEGVEVFHLLDGNQMVGVWIDIKLRLAKVDVYPLDNSLIQRK